MIPTLPATTKSAYKKLAQPLSRSARQTMGGALLLLASALVPSLAQAQSIQMVNIPAGSFMMGSCAKQSAQDAFLGNAAGCSPQDPDALSSEMPRHRVSVPAFQMGKTEVTVGQFKAYIKATGRTDLVDSDFINSNNEGDNAPVGNVSWNDAQAFIGWLNQTEGGGWRLPSEAEWEYACRAGGQQRYCGSDLVGEVAWHEDNSGKRAHAVATKSPNAWGLYDMSGNVFEWTQDCWNDNYRGAPSQGGAWTSGKCDHRVLRGGAWNNGVHHTRTGSRGSNAVGARFSDDGFRLARTR